MSESADAWEVYRDEIKRVGIASYDEVRKRKPLRWWTIREDLNPTKPLTRPTNGDDPSGYFKGEKGLFRAVYWLLELIKASQQRGRSLLQFGQRDLNAGQINSIKQWLNVNDITGFRPAINAGANCSDVLWTIELAWDSVLRVAEHLDPAEVTSIQVTLGIARLIMEDVQREMMGILTAENYRWDVFKEIPEEYVATACKIATEALKETPPRILDPSLLSLSLIPVPHRERRIARSIAHGRRCLAELDRHCATKLYEHASRIRIRAEEVRTATEKAMGLPLDLLAEVRQAIRLLGIEAKAVQIKKHLGRRSDDVSKVLAYLKSTGEWRGVRGNGSRNGSHI